MKTDRDCTPKDVLDKTLLHLIKYIYINVERVSQAKLVIETNLHPAKSKIFSINTVSPYSPSLVLYHPIQHHLYTLNGSPLYRHS
jgi:hypothetical protein